MFNSIFLSVFWQILHVVEMVRTLSVITLFCTPRWCCAALWMQILLSAYVSAGLTIRQPELSTPYLPIESTFPRTTPWLVFCTTLSRTSEITELWAAGLPIRSDVRPNPATFMFSQQVS